MQIVVLAQLKKLKREGPYLFPNKLDPTRPMGRQGHKKAWTTCKRKAGVEGRFHDLRHTALTNAFKRSNNWTYICAFGGLSLEEAERTYLHITHGDTKGIAELWENHGKFEQFRNLHLSNNDLEDTLDSPQASALPG